jgi:hypothetical protein
MLKELAISVEKDVYEALLPVIERNEISEADIIAGYKRTLSGKKKLRNGATLL